jgi:flotillin
MNFVLLGAIVLGSIVLLATLIGFVSKNYIKIPPNTAAVIFGRKKTSSSKSEDGAEVKVSKGYRVVAGGGVFKIPIIEEVQFMNLSNRSLNVDVKKAPNKDGVMTTIEGVANVKFSSENSLLQIAVERFLGRSDDEVNRIILQNLEGHLRAVVGKMTMEQLIGDKTALNQAVMDEANDDFNKMGIEIDFINIQDIRDDDNYILNLGRKRAAEIKRDADIGEAEAKRDATKKTSIAEREAVEVSNTNQEKIYESNKTRDVKEAEMKAMTDAEREKANQAGPLSQAKALKEVVEAQAKTEAAQEKALVEVEEAKALKEEKRFIAEKIVPAEADKKARIINANASKESQIIEADGAKESTILKAKGDADAVLLAKKAEAEGEAAVVRERGQAEADAIEAKLLAEAKGIKEKAEAYAALDQTGKFLEVLNSLQTLGPNLVKEFAGVMAASTAHLSNVKDIKIIDFGGQGSKGGTTVGKFGSAPVEILTKFAEAANGTGFDISKLFNFIGVDPKEVGNTTAKEEVNFDEVSEEEKENKESK